MMKMTGNVQNHSLITFVFTKHVKYVLYTTTHKFNNNKSVINDKTTSIETKKI